MKQAVIYCRVSSKKQVKEGHGLTSQESTCRQYAVAHGFTVQRVFTDDFTGGGSFWNRPGICALLEFLDDQPGATAVIFDDIKRFARDTAFHLQLRQELGARNAQPHCPTFRFEDTPEGEFIETVLAANAQLERQQNRRQVIRRMKARFRAGHWMFPPPVGYKRTKKNGEKLMVLDEACCDDVREALERFADGRLPTQKQVVLFLDQRNCRSKWSQGSTYSAQAVQRLLRNELYAGWCVCKKWGERVRGVHEPLISEETHRRIRDRLRSSSQVVPPQGLREEFPLRGHIQCASCARLVTASWAQGRSQKYPYYRCMTPGCINIRAERMEEAFCKRLSEAVPSRECLRLFEADLVDFFRDRQSLRSATERARESRLNEIDNEIEVYVSSVGRSSTERAQRLYEDKISALQAEQETIERRLGREHKIAVEPLLKKGRDLLLDPLRYWQKGDLTQRRRAQMLVFETPILFDRLSGYRTAQFSLLYRLLGQSTTGKSSLVDLLSADTNPVAEEIERWKKLL